MCLFSLHTDDGLSKNRNVCTYCYAHKIMKFITYIIGEIIAKDNLNIENMMQTFENFLLQNY